MSINPYMVNDLGQQVRALLLRYPEIADDEQLLIDMLEGSTDFHQVIQKVFNYMAECEMMASAIGDRIAKMGARKSRMEKNVSLTRNLIQQIMTDAGVKKIDVTEASISLRESPDKIIITDESLIPDEFMKIKKDPDKAALKKAFDEGKSVIGAVLSNGGTTIQIRR